MSLLDKSNPALHLYLLPDPFQVLKYPPTTRIPQSIISNPDYTFLSLTRTPVELSIVYSSSSSSSPSPSSASSPSPTSKELDHSLIEELGKPEETGPEWRCIRVQGPMEHSMVGIMASLTAPLRDCQH
ncbi:hypothetical protein BCR39DRAFT_532718 [Naematelia encephala]|uniref:Uncharacterized protein n=1 Tax=Naematelia encephala TaxID=71784 RepID=A0A1Y2B318_9TREE|nr:hypothetical protein BCR39DRAFT_532718 [Naematelia encephala]